MASEQHDQDDVNHLSEALNHLRQAQQAGLDHDHDDAQAAKCLADAITNTIVANQRQTMTTDNHTNGDDIPQPIIDAAMDALADISPCSVSMAIDAVEQTQPYLGDTDPAAMLAALDDDGRVTTIGNTVAVTDTPHQ